MNNQVFAKTVVDKYLRHYGFPTRIFKDQDFEICLICKLLRFMGICKLGTSHNIHMEEQDKETTLIWYVENLANACNTTNREALIF